MKSRAFIISAIFMVLSAAGFIGEALAVPTQSSALQINSPFAISNSDFLQTSSATISGTGNFNREGMQGLSALNNGVYGPQGGSSSNGGAAFSAGAGDVAVISFPQVNGVTLNSLVSTAAWDGARASQAFQFEYQSTVLPGVWHRLSTVNYNPGFQSGNTNTQVTLTDSTGTLARNVSQIRFNYADTPGWQWNGYREIDATGSVSAAPSGPQFLNSVRINEGFTPSGSDLLQGGGINTTWSGIFTDEGATGVSSLTDGGFGALGNAGSGGASATANLGEMVTFTLDLAASPGGYSLSGIDTYSGWDTYRGGQYYSVSYSLVGDPGTFFSLGTIDWDARGDNAPGGNISTRSMLRDADGELATGVAAVRFNFANSNFIGYREIDIFGTAVPEPGTCCILSLGLASILVRRR